MEDVLDVYCRPYDAARPVVCLDETSKPLAAEVRPPLPASPGQSQRYDVEYERRGVAEVFLFTEPLGGWRRTAVTAHRARLDWAAQIRQLVEADYPQAEMVVLVMDNLNTHNAASLYEAFEPAVARQLARRIDQMEKLQTECSAWDRQRNTQQKGVDWRFTTADARIKLKRLYPQIQL